MADGDAFMMEDDEDYDLEYDEESGSEPDVDLENQYYNSKALKEVDKNKSLESFKKVLELEGSNKGEWGFRALKQMLKLNFKMRRYEEMMKNYQALLTYMRSAVTRNYSEKSINSILEHISSSDNMTLLENFYNITLDALRDMKNERLWFKTNCKLGKLFFDRGEYQKVARITRQLHQSCQTAYGDDDQCKGTQLMEVYALEIQMHSAQKNSKALKKVYEQSLQVKSAIPHPLIMGGIRECGGKMHLREGQFQAAHTDFFEAFKNYDESGSQRRITCLKYLVLANLLMNSDINPFDSQEAKAYKNDPEIVAMTDLITAYQNHDIEEFEKILRKPANRLLNDEFIKEHVKMLLTNVRTEILRKIIQPYLSITLDFVASKLNTSVDEVHQLLKKSIIEGEINGLIDETTQTLFIDSGENSDIAWNNAYEPWLESLCSLQQAISTRIFA